MVYGGSGADLAQGDPGNDTVYGGSGDDTMFGGTGTDTLFGGDDNDGVFGSIGNDTIYGGSGSDEVGGGDDDDTIYGDAGSDTLNGGSGGDILYGGEESDTLSGDVVVNVLRNGSFSNEPAASGNNDLDPPRWNTFESSATNIQVTSSGQVAFNRGDTAPNPNNGIVQNVSNITPEQTVFVSYDYDVTGSGNNALSSVRLDVIDSGDNIVLSLPSTLTPSTISGSFFVPSTSDGEYRVVIRDTSTGTVGTDPLVDNVEFIALQGSNFNDTLYGGSGNDTIEGTQGNDAIYGDEGADQLFGGDDSDTFFGVGDGDVVDGGTGTTSGNEVDDFDTIDGIDLADQGILWRFNTVSVDADGNSRSGEIEFISGPQAGEIFTFTEIESLICFGAQTPISTPCGSKHAGSLKIGDLVLTADAGPRPIRWIAQRHLRAEQLAHNPKLRPIRIEASALGDGLPQETVLVSPQHRVLIRTEEAQKLFGEKEVLVAAKALLPLKGVSVAEDVDTITYVHFLLDEHQIVFAAGAKMESLYTGPQAMKMLSEEQREELFALFPELQQQQSQGIFPPGARPLAKGKPVRLMIEKLTDHDTPDLQCLPLHLQQRKFAATPLYGRMRH